MKNHLILGMFLLAGLLLPLPVTRAQGTIYLSNLGQASATSAAIGSDSWVALSFATGTNAAGYQLNSFQLAMTNATGTPSGFMVMLYSAVGSGEVSPGNSLGTLIGSTNPAARGTFAYTPANSLTLLPNKSYFFVLTSGTAIATGAYEWANTSAFPLTYHPSGGWQAPLGLARVDNYQSGNGSSWGIFTTYPEFAIGATAVPEPGVFALFSLGGVGLFCFRRRLSRDGIGA